MSAPITELGRLANTIAELARYPDLLRDIMTDLLQQRPATSGVDWRRESARVRMGDAVQVGDWVTFYPPSNGVIAGRVAAIGRRGAAPGHILLIVGADGNLCYREDVYCWLALDQSRHSGQEDGDE